MIARGTRTAGPEAGARPCPLCSYRFEKGAESCGRCPLHDSCGVTICPRCGYEFVERSVAVEALKGLGRGIRILLWRDPGGDEGR